MSSDRLQRKVSEVSALYEVSRVLGSSLDLHQTAERAFEILHKMLGLGRGTLVLQDPESGDYRIWAGYGLSKREIERGQYRVGEGVTGKVLQSGLPMAVPDIGKEPLFLNKTKARDLEKRAVSFICVPIQVKGETLGVLSADRVFKDDEHSLEDDVRFLTVLASLMGQAAKLGRSVDETRRELEREKQQLQSELKGKYSLDNMVGGSRKMQEVYETVERVAPSRATALIRGESGTGKELVARALHYNSPRSKKPFIRVSCAALPETLLESELFGHERGAFTGATERRAGRFELAHGGTLFLDEIGEISLATQVKLLRVLQERKFERLGGAQTLSVDVRVVAATHRDLEAAIVTGEFREDLYYRLNVIPIYLPALREREGDVPLLIEHFLAKANDENSKEVKLTRAALEKLAVYPWPGNVRELEHCLERVVVLARRGLVDVDDLPLSVRESVAPAGLPMREGLQAAPGRGGLPAAVRDIEKEQILKTLRDCNGVQIRVARALGLTQRQLGYKIKKYGIKLKVAQA